jgi:hypothetical protein
MSRARMMKGTTTRPSDTGGWLREKVKDRRFLSHGRDRQVTDDHWSKFYWLKWRGNANLARCSKAAKGVWMDMLSLMFQCEVRGVLSTGGEPWSDEEIAAAIGGDIGENLSCIHELTSKSVAKRNNRGAIYSHRMVVEQQLRKERASAGRKGGYAKAGKPPSKNVANAKQRGKQTLSVSTSDSALASGSGPPEGGPGETAPMLRTDCADTARQESNQAVVDAAITAFSRWSGRDRGRELSASANEYAHVAGLVSLVAEATPIIRHGEHVSRATMIPHAVQAVMDRRKSPQFKTIQFAVGVIRNQLQEWADLGLGKDESNGTHRQHSRPGRVWNNAKHDREFASDPGEAKRL